MPNSLEISDFAMRYVGLTQYEYDIAMQHGYCNCEPCTKFHKYLTVKSLLDSDGDNIEVQEAQEAQEAQEV